MLLAWWWYSFSIALYPCHALLPVEATGNQAANGRRFHIPPKADETGGKATRNDPSTPRQNADARPVSRPVPPILHHTPFCAQRLFVELALVEGELLALEDVAVAAAGLAGAAGDDGVQATGLELLLDGGLDLARGGEASSLLLLDRLALLDLLNGLALLLLATTADGLAVVSLVPLTEGSSVDLDDGGLGQGVGADKLVVGRMVCKLGSAMVPTASTGRR